MSKGVLLFCTNTPTCEYHKIAEHCISLIQKNLKLEITVVTDFATYKKFKPMGMINYKLIEPELGNKRLGEQWNNLERRSAYDFSPYDTTILIDCDYFCYTDNLLEYTNLQEDFLVHDKIHDLTQTGVYNFRDDSIIPMIWATVIIFKKTQRVKNIFNMVSYIKDHYQYFCEMYSIKFTNFRNDYAFSIALNQINGMTQQQFLPGKIATLPGLAKVKKFNEHGLVFEYDNKYAEVENQDVHVINKEIFNV